MKKFVLGFLCASAFFVAGAAAFASNEIKALISSINVSFHVHGETNDLSSDNTIALNYKGQLYVPLRAFTEKVGGDVHYKEEENGGKMVDIYLADDRDLELQDKDGYVRMGHLDVKFAEEGDPSSISGTIKFTRSIPQNKDIVLAILDRDGKEAGVTEPLRLLNQKVSQSVGGDIASFEAAFPYMKPVDGYKLEARVVDKTDWTFFQSYGNLHGAGGVQGYPLVATLGGDVSNPKNVPFELNVNLINLDEENTISIVKPVSFDIEIIQLKDDKTIPIRTIRTKPFAGELVRQLGGVVTAVQWDQKNDKGVVVPPGEYWARLKLPVTAQGEHSSYVFENSMRAKIPVFIDTPLP
ncbi:hypothetical protein [Paenibacillus soyae]|uniref:Copper amine oxidase N-terminal domain-containing protein n=1 Tax=Paenibacillus soyae TaxID=2969249 RepID=A0A9X2N2C4_9BACL|nr:hypothetical protein [Paenibacillus soyae]MCR2807777.1 hypothetical protein [Paenibacillus soyae]